MSGPVRYHLGDFPPTNIDWARLVPLIGRANAALARYDGLMAAIPNASVLLSPLTTQEAVLSSKIEGTRVTMREVLELEAGGEPANLSESQRGDVEEVLNYRLTLDSCAKEVEERPLSEHLLRQAHARLMRGVRGRDKAPGSYRTDQNWIGAPGCGIEEAAFVPIAPEQLIPGMERWMKFVLSGSEPDGLVQLAIIHVEFEALHPFRDGNGRLGRMLIPLFLYQTRLLSSPNFFISGYLEARREAYQERLRAVSREGAWTEWCAFFLEGVVEQAAENEEKARAILLLYERVKNQVVDLTHSQHAIRTVDFLFQHPTFAAPRFVNDALIPAPSAKRILRALRESGLLRTLRVGRGQQPGIHAFPELLNVAEGRRIV